MTKHLDLGCGLKPRNPYGADATYGCDVRDIDLAVEKIGFDYKRVNLVVEPIPYPDGFFDSISAFDFLEHIPRQMVLPNGEVTNPFINIMSEIHRVLVPGGRLLAFTPAYPRAEAFSDPTHVNFITDKTHEYFVGSKPSGAMYGFKGAFEALQVRWEAPANVYDLNQPSWRKTMRRMHRQILRGGMAHILWEFVAIGK